jgi:hypothetical protein
MSAASRREREVRRLASLGRVVTASGIDEESGLSLAGSVAPSGSGWVLSVERYKSEGAFGTPVDERTWTFPDSDAALDELARLLGITVGQAHTS